MLGGVEDLTEGLGNLCAIGVGERLDATGSFPDFQGIDLDLDNHRGARRVRGVHRGATTPAGDHDGEIVAGLGAQPCPGRFDEESAGLWSEPVGTGATHGRKATRRQHARRCHRSGHDHGGDRAGPRVSFRLTGQRAISVPYRAVSDGAWR